MITKTKKVKTKSAVPRVTKASKLPKVSREQSDADLLQKIPYTTEERLQHIQVLGKRVDGYVQYMCRINSMVGTSMEAKDRAVAVFYERLLFMERQLGRIQEELDLG